MFRILLAFILTAFLFISIVSTARVLFSSNARSTKNLIVQATDYETTRASIKEIDKITANNNSYFTSKNSLR